MSVKNSKGNSIIARETLWLSRVFIYHSSLLEFLKQADGSCSFYFFFLSILPSFSFLLSFTLLFFLSNSSILPFFLIYHHFFLLSFVVFYMFPCFVSSARLQHHLSYFYVFFTLPHSSVSFTPFYFLSFLSFHLTRFLQSLSPLPCVGKRPLFKLLLSVTRSITRYDTKDCKRATHYFTRSSLRESVPIPHRSFILLKFRLFLPLTSPKCIPLIPHHIRVLFLISSISDLIFVWFSLKFGDTLFTHTQPSFFAAPQEYKLCFFGFLL